MTKAKRKINEFNFDTEGAHVALVDKAANGQSVLVMKSLKASEEEIKKALSKDVTVKMTIMEFLTRHLDMWWDDAEIVAGLLGYTADDLVGGFEDSASSIVDYVQANIDSVQINKSANKEQVETFNKFLEKFASFEDKYLEKNLTSSVESEDEDVVTKAEDDKPTNEEVEMTQDEIQEMINKAAGDLAKEQVQAVEKAYEAKVEATNKELQVLKAAHETRTAQEYLTKAAEYTQYLGEDADKEAIAKALRAVEGLEEAAPLLDVLKALKDVASKDDLLEEVGKSATEDQPSDTESKIVALQKSFMEADKTLSKPAAYVKAADQILAESH